MICDRLTAQLRNTLDEQRPGEVAPLPLDGGHEAAAAAAAVPVVDLVVLVEVVGAGEPLAALRAPVRLDAGVAAAVPRQLVRPRELPSAA